ncbi:LuxR C-terminal-related transcriptional regulator [Deinococcus pimensis]|uniref:LuxR C-terminal-related transcriptional regulator n=1 Tax=Deinococcus pimensis TaxID=309888 RepID=UPI00146FA046|nr:LuxR C-terminal-related transcriptional regulator [Deinococcus pimensis]
MTLLTRDDVALVTLTGFGGMGKTTLAEQVRVTLHGVFPDGAVLVPLADVVDVDGVPRAVARHLDLPVDGDPASTVLRALSERETLLILDNFEHLLDAASFVSDVLVAAPRTKLLVTSRSPLQLTGEHEVPVLPLALPSREDDGRPDRLKESPAVQLFVERVGAQASAPEWTPETLTLAASIVRRLGGWPLGIELAATRARLMSLAALRDHLDAQLDFLTRGARDLPARQRTLRATLDWGFALLDPTERRLLAHLGVFRGPFTARAALDAFEGVATLDALSALVEHGWALADDQDTFRLLEPVREYALEVLSEQAADAAARAAHARWVSRTVQAAWASLERQCQPEYLRDIDAVLPDVRAALTWTLDARAQDEALGMLRVLGQYWLVRGHFHEGRGWAEAWLARFPDAPGEPDVLGLAGLLAWRQGDTRAAEAYHARALTHADATLSAKGTADALRGLAHLALTRGDPARAREFATNSLDAAGRAGDDLGVHASLATRGVALMTLGDLTHARQDLQAALDGARTRHRPVLVALRETHLGNLERLAGRRDEARARLTRALHDSRALHARQVECSALHALALLELDEGQFDLARTHLDEGLRIGRAIGADALVAQHLEALGTLAARERRPDEARARWTDALDGWTRVGNQVRQDDLARRLALPIEARPPDPPAGTTGGSAPTWDALYDLTPRELDVVRLVAQGRSNQLIARGLGVSVPTVNAHLRTVFSKLGITTRVMLTRIAVERGWLDE